MSHTSIGFIGKIEDEQQANAFRIIAAVNACAGIPTGNLEAGGALETIIKERDELLAALKEARGYLGGRPYYAACDAIDRAEGNQTTKEES